MHQIADDYEVRAVFSLKPLVEYWTKVLAPSDSHWAAMFGEIRKDLEKVPALLEPIEDLSLLAPHRDLMRRLMSPVFPPAFWNTELLGALVPITLNPVYVSPLFERLLLREDGSFQGKLNLEWETFRMGRIIRCNLLILRNLYDVKLNLDYPVIRIVQDPETGLDRHFKFKPDLRFIEVHPLGELKKLSDSDISAVMENFTDPALLSELLPPENFEFHGFTIIHAVDVTESEVISYLERSLIDKKSTFSPSGFVDLQGQLRTLFKLPDLVAGMAAIQKDQALLLNCGCEMACECIFAGSVHVPVTEFAGSVYEQAVNESRIMRIRDLQEEPNITNVEREFLKAGVRSLLVAPLYYQGEPIGMLSLGSPRPGTLGPAEALLISRITPLFSMALNRSLEELDNRVQAIIKEKCTAVHPSVEWMFRKNVFRHLERLQSGEASEMEPVVFRDVYPLYAASDIRGSSETRNDAIRKDLAEHLQLAADVVSAALEAKPLPILQELTHRLSASMRNVKDGSGTGDDVTAIHLMRKEVEPLFPFLQTFDSRVSEAIAAYEATMDSNLRTVYRKRKDFEDSVALLNERISAYLDREEAEMQAVIPHYFNKHQTDGLDYLMYLGASMIENGDFNDLYLKNLRLWQIMVSCGIAWHAEQMKPALKVPLDLTHIILVNNSPLSVRFRFDEKRFDVDGAYDVGHEIIRSRIDKATVKGREERLTQPGRIAIVYSRIQEADETRRHIDFLISRGLLHNDLELLEIDDLPGVQGLRAFRVGVNLESPSLAERCRKMGT
jgi:hypothetical protein